MVYRFLTLTLMVAILAACNDHAVVEPEPEPQLTGAACSSADECIGDLCLEELGPETSDPITFPDGYCTNNCDWEDVDEDGYVDPIELVGCLAGDVCLFYDPDYYDDVPAVGYCFQGGCETDWDCRDPNYVCYDFGFWEPVKACVPYDAVDPATTQTENSTMLLYNPYELDS